MVLGKKVVSFDLERVRNSAPRDGQKIPCFSQILMNISFSKFVRSLNISLGTWQSLY